MIFLLLFFMILILSVSYIFSDRDIFSPSVVLCIAYIVSILSACVNVNVWAINLHFNTFIVILIGTIIFFIVNVISMQIGKSIFHINKRKKVVTFDYITIQKFKTVAVCCLGIVVALLYYKAVKSIANNAGSFTDFSSMMNLYRMSTSYSLEESVPTALNQMVKVSYTCSMIYMYVFINNSISLDKHQYKERKDNLFNLLPVVIYSIQALLTGGRFDLLKMICFMVIIYNVLWHRKNGWNKTKGIKFLFKCVIGLIIVFGGFYLLKAVVGRTNQEDIITYITNYTGGSIQLLDMYLQNPIEKSNILGKESFYALNMFLQKIGILNFEPYIIHLEFRTSNGVMIGNVYTAFRRYIQDFGVLGMMVFQTILGAFYGIFYSYVKYVNSKKKLDYPLMIYALIFYPIFLHSINDYFFSGIISVNYIIIFALIKIESILLIEKKIILK